MATPSKRCCAGDPAHEAEAENTTVMIPIKMM
jgi:hypothetical protein